MRFLLSPVMLKVLANSRGRGTRVASARGADRISSK
jgi:hypothetical protein